MNHHTHSVLEAKVRVAARHNTSSGRSGATVAPTDQLQMRYTWMMPDSEDEDPFLTAPLPDAMGAPVSTPAEVVPLRTSTSSASGGLCSLAASSVKEQEVRGCPSATFTAQHQPQKFDGFLVDTDEDEDPLLSAPLPSVRLPESTPSQHSSATRSTCTSVSTDLGSTAGGSSNEGQASGAGGGWCSQHMSQFTPE